MKRVLILLFCLCLLAGCGLREQPAGPTPAPGSGQAGSPSPTAEPAPPRDALTGAARETASNRRPIAVMFNNLPGAYPQWGISAAKVVLEGVTEGKTTWLMGLYSGDEALPKVGPVGPARDLFLQFAMPMNAIPVHIGHNTYALNLLNRYSYQDVNGYYVGVSVFDMDYERSKATNNEYSWFTRQESLQNGYALCGISPEGTVPALFNFGETVQRPEGAAGGAQSLTVGYSAQTAVRLDYDAAQGFYLKFAADGAPHTDADTGAQLAFENVLVLYSSAGVKDDGYTRDYDLTQGKGLYLSQGTWQAIQWQKGAADAPLYLYDQAGEPLFVNPGRSYIGIWGGFAGQTLQLVDEAGAAQELPGAPAPMPTPVPTPEPTPAPAEDAPAQG